jgi:hypothetical protein
MRKFKKRGTSRKKILRGQRQATARDKEADFMANLYQVLTIMHDQVEMRIDVQCTRDQDLNKPKPALFKSALNRECSVFGGLRQLVRSPSV